MTETKRNSPTSAPQRRVNKRDRQTHQLESHSAFAARLGVSPRTVDRWTEDGILPRPIIINKRKYWDPATEPRRDADVA